MIFRLFLLIASLFAGWRIWRRLRYFLHLFQLEGYKPDEYSAWVRKNAGRVLFRLSHKIGLGILTAAGLGFRLFSALGTALVALPSWAVAFASSRLYRSENQKKPLNYTPRLKRLLAAAASITLVPVVTGAAFGLKKGAKGVWTFLAGLWVADFGAPLWVRLAGSVMEPIEEQVHRGFIRQARAKLRDRRDLRIVGITGSYGKTSTKFIVEELLSQKQNVLATPGSYNTPMGLCLVINEKLRPEHQVLVLEYGIRHPGDMDDLLEVARPQVGVVTTIGPAHLEHMGTLGNIQREKQKLIEGLPEGAPAVLNLDDERVATMREAAPGEVWTVSAEGNEDADIWATNIDYDREGASFDVTDDTGTTATFRVRLLGHHNVLNILMAIAVGRTQGLRLRQMAHAAQRLEPVEHRLELRQEGEITVIDDAFNANPVGAKNAVEILSQFSGGRRVIVTPGMIELGERQHAENKTLGEHIARQGIDLALLVGDEQTRPIQEGLQAQNYPDDQMKVMSSLFEAQDFMKDYLRPGDVVLYENDLPDQYEVS